MSRRVQTATEKRQFLGLAWYPNGGDVAIALHMFPQSPDVDELEERTNAVMQRGMYSTGPMLDNALTLAEWYTEAMKAADAADLPVGERTFNEHLVSFLMASLPMLAKAVTDG